MSVSFRQLNASFFQSCVIKITEMVYWKTLISSRECKLELSYGITNKPNKSTLFSLLEPPTKEHAFNELYRKFNYLHK